MPPLKKELPSVEPRVKRKGATRKNHSIVPTRFSRVYSQFSRVLGQNKLLLALYKAITPILIAAAVHYVKVLFKVTVP